MSDDALGDHALACIRRTLAMGDADVLFAHVIRWESGLATFAPGRFKEMAAVRALLARWDAPLDCCGDYLDGIASEGALRTGEQAAQRMAQRLSHAPSVNRSSASPSIRSSDMSSRDRASHAAAH
jgi:predicted NAD/FAD-dependent oxidoreductase